MEKTLLDNALSGIVKKHLHGRGEDARRCTSRRSFAETPPRTWRRLLLQDAADVGLRNTSTDVEKTRRIPPRMGVALETPPRTWRRHPLDYGYTQSERNTSTDVEKTDAHRLKCVGIKKHLHGRGEDAPLGILTVGHLETPPRTWRRLGCRQCHEFVLGNTSTDVEKTTPLDVWHLAEKETPPRTWRRLGIFRQWRLGRGNTSTDVEKTSFSYQ